MPFGGMLTMGIGALGAGLGAWGSSGKQGSTQSTATSTSTMTPTEPGYQTSFRQAGMGDLSSFLSQMMQGPYGQAQVSQGVQNIQQAGNAATGQTLQSLARSGRLNSGSADTALTGIGQKTAGDISSWMNQVPLLNYQATSSAVSPLLSTWANWAGKAPTGQITTGNQSSNTTDSGASFLQNLASNFGGMAASGGFNPAPSTTAINPNYTPPVDWSQINAGTPTTAPPPGWGTINLPSWNSQSSGNGWG